MPLIEGRTPHRSSSQAPLSNLKVLIMGSFIPEVQVHCLSTHFSFRCNVFSRPPGCPDPSRLWASPIFFLLFLFFYIFPKSISHTPLEPTGWSHLWAALLELFFLFFAFVPTSLRLYFFFM